MDLIELDWRGMRCPEPILKTARRVRKLRDGSPKRLSILADDDAFPQDITGWCSNADVILERVHERDGFYEAIVSLGSPEDYELIEHPQPVTFKETNPEVPPVNVLDCRGMKCPEPIMKLARHVRTMQPGEELQILADDDAFPQDVRSWSSSARVDLLDLSQAPGGGYVARVKAHETPRTASRPPESNTTLSAPPAVAAPVSSPSAPEPKGLVIHLDDAPEAQRMARVTSMAGPSWVGERVTFRTRDGALLQEIVGWVGGSGHHLERFDAAAGSVTIKVGAEAAPTALVPAERGARRATFLVIHNDFESLMAALMVANSTAAQNIETSIFFSFWGVNLLRGDRPRASEPKGKLSFIHRMFRWMMPKGPTRQPLSKMHFGGVGMAMMKASMEQQNIMSLETLMQEAVENGVQFTVCTMSMSIMGIQKRDIMELSNLDFAGVASFVTDASKSEMSMVF